MIEHGVPSDAPCTRTIEEELAEAGVFYGTTSGVSMKPLLRHRGQTIVLRPLGGARACKHDIVLARRVQDGHYILHRVIRVLEDGYITRGDNCLHRDAPISEKQLLARFEGYYRGDAFIAADARRCRLYLRLWVQNPCRTLYLALREAARALWHRCRRKKNT